MPLLHVALQEGFTGDTVVIRAGGKEVFRKSNVKTRLQTGFADSAETEMSPGSVAVNIELPEKRVSESFTVDLKNNLYLGISLGPDNQIKHKVSAEPFGYV